MKIKVEVGGGKRKGRKMKTRIVKANWDYIEEPFFDWVPHFLFLGERFTGGSRNLWLHFGYWTLEITW